MVSKSADQRASVGARSETVRTEAKLVPKSRKRVQKPSAESALLITFLLLIVSIAGLTVKLYNERTKQAEQVTETAKTTEIETDSSASEIADANSENEEKLPAKIDFQGIIESWAAGAGGKKSVVIYDLDRGETAGKYNANATFNTASLYKLFVVYEGYRRVENGEWQRTDPAGRTGNTILQCLDLAIRESNSACAETLWSLIGHDTLDEIIAQDFEITNSDISSLVTNATDVAKMMRIFYEHPDIKDAELVATMQDSFLNQPVTTDDWRKGLPSGFPASVKVYNKVGWDWNGKSWNVYHDAAIVESPEQNRHFVVVVMTSEVKNQKIAELGTLISNAVLEN